MTRIIVFGLWAGAGALVAGFVTQGGHVKAASALAITLHMALTTVRPIGV
jgi:hypothetical protein